MKKEISIGTIVAKSRLSFLIFSITLAFGTSALISLLANDRYYLQGKPLIYAVELGIDYWKVGDFFASLVLGIALLYCAHFIYQYHIIVDSLRLVADRSYGCTSEGERRPDVTAISESIAALEDAHRAKQPDIVAAACRAKTWALVALLAGILRWVF